MSTRAISSALVTLTLGIAGAFAGCGENSEPVGSSTQGVTTHWWGWSPTTPEVPGYHWPDTRPTSPTSPPAEINLTIRNHLTGLNWPRHLGVAIGDWNVSAIINLAQGPHGGSNPRCRPTAGEIAVCNANYGRNGWLGLAQIWIGVGNHITQGTTQVNDTYFNLAAYNNDLWRQFVMCQEIGHDFGLGHQDENFSNPNLGSCMDYTNSPATNQHPNADDYYVIGYMYSSHSHGAATTGTTTPAASGGSSAVGGTRIDTGNGEEDVGHPVASDGRGRAHTFIRSTGPDTSVVTFVYWAD